MTKNDLGMIMPRNVPTVATAEINIEEMMAEKIRKYFGSRDLAGIDLRNLGSVGKETLRGMVVNLMDRLWRLTLCTYPCGEQDEKEYVGIADYLMDMMNSVAPEKPCCLPMYRIEDEHFTAGSMVRVFYKGSWVRGTVLMPPKLGIDFQDTIAVYKLMTVEIKGDEPQTLQFDFRDIRVLQEVEYLNMKTGFDEEFFGILKSHVNVNTIESDNCFGAERNAAVEKLIELSLDPTEQIFSFTTRGEKIAIMWNHMWVKGRISLVEHEYCPTVVELDCGEPQAVILTIYDKVIPLELLEQLVASGRIPEDMVAKTTIDD